MEKNGAEVVGCLVWYDESPAWLMAAIAAVAPLLDHLVAVDGAYALYPGGVRRPASAVEQSIAVVEAASASNVSLTLSRPTTVWYGNEVGKRQYALDLALQAAKPVDGWVLVFDADNVARPFDAGRVRDALRSADACAAAEYGVLEDQHGESLTATPVRGIYRALPGLRYGPAHWTVSAPMDDGVLWLWGDPRIHRPYADAVDLRTKLVFDNRRDRRPRQRNVRAKTYYERRDQTGIEALLHTYSEGLDGEPVWHTSSVS